MALQVSRDIGDKVKAMDMRNIESLNHCDYAHVSPNCLSNSVMSLSIHKRKEENNYEGVTVEAAEFDATVSDVADILAQAKKSNPAFTFTFEQPRSKVSDMSVEPRA
jgi:hypothetical protein